AGAGASGGRHDRAVIGSSQIAKLILKPDLRLLRESLARGGCARRLGDDHQFSRGTRSDIDRGGYNHWQNAAAETQIDRFGVRIGEVGKCGETALRGGGRGAEQDS